MRRAAWLTGLGVLLVSCGGAPDLGDMTAAEAERACLRKAGGVVVPSKVNATVTHKEDRYWDVLLDVDPPQNLVFCTIDAVDGDIIRFSDGYTRRAARKALRGGLWDDRE